jgi:hypothetical protein
LIVLPKNFLLLTQASEIRQLKLHLLIHLNGGCTRTSHQNPLSFPRWGGTHIYCALLIPYFCRHYFSKFCWQIFVSVFRQIFSFWKMCHDLLKCTVLLCRNDWNTCTELLYIFYRHGKVRGIQGTMHYSGTFFSLINCKWEHLNKQQQFKKNKNKSMFLTRKNTKIVLFNLWDFIIINVICRLQAQVFPLLKMTVSNDALLKPYS